MVDEGRNWREQWETWLKAKKEIRISCSGEQRQQTFFFFFFFKGEEEWYKDLTGIVRSNGVRLESFISVSWLRAALLSRTEREGKTKKRTCGGIERRKGGRLISFAWFIRGIEFQTGFQLYKYPIGIAAIE